MQHCLCALSPFLSSPSLSPSLLSLSLPLFLSHPLLSLIFLTVSLLSLSFPSIQITLSALSVPPLFIRIFHLTSTHLLSNSSYFGQEHTHSLDYFEFSQLLQVPTAVNTVCIIHVPKVILHDVYVLELHDRFCWCVCVCVCVCGCVCVCLCVCTHMHVCMIHIAVEKVRVSLY